MEVIALLLIVYFLIGACICLLVCVNPNDRGTLGSMNRFVFHKLPTIFRNVVVKIFGERVANFFSSIKHYLMETNHPIVQIFYLLIAVGGFALYEIYGIFKFMPNKIIGDIEVILANVMAIICFWVYYKACATSPGQITKKNEKEYVERFQKYYDGVTYKQNNKCRTCHVIKPARSKHCSVCGICVSKFDHHCIWIRQCVGEKNYKYFVSFLALHSIWCLFLSLIGTLSLINYIQQIRFIGRTFNIDGRQVKADFFLAIQYLFMSQTIFFFLIVMTAIMGFTLFIFVSYHFYLIYKGNTTNQRVKRNDDIEYYRKQTKAIIMYQEQMEKEKLKEITIRDEKFSVKDLADYKEQICRRKAIIQKEVDKRGFIAKLQQILLN